jgi:hypothetical protein
MDRECMREHNLGEHNLGTGGRDLGKGENEI